MKMVIILEKVNGFQLKELQDIKEVKHLDKKFFNHKDMCKKSIKNMSVNQVNINQFNKNTMKMIDQKL